MQRFLLGGICFVMAAASIVGCNSKDAARDFRALEKSGSIAFEDIADDLDQPELDREAYDHIVENSFINALQNPKSTFSIDVDTASYSNVRRMLNEGSRPPAGAVRIEELINYFRYDYPAPSSEHPFSVTTELAQCPWQTGHQLVRIGLKGKEIEQENRPPANLVFLLDVSGSMNNPNKLPLVKSAMRLLVENLDEQDRIAIAVYASASGLVLPSTPANESAKILAAIDQLDAGGSTNGGQGIQLAYNTAEKNFIDGGINRVILCTDGDFNVGTTSQSELVKLIKKKASGNVFLSLLGFGTGNLNDSTMEKLADHGNGNYAYIDSMLEARKTLVQEMGSTLITIAKDVKIQVDFNPARVDSYRLIGYENRLLANEDFEDDSKDAGEIGAGHTVTAIYEIVPTGTMANTRVDSPSRFVESKIREDANPDSILFVNLRYKEPESNQSKLILAPLDHPLSAPVPEVEGDFKFVSAVAAFGMKLRESAHSGDADWDWIIETATTSQGVDADGFRNEFIGLAKRARMILKN